jgi:hypothetical protein
VKIPQPIWYTKTEDFLLTQGRPVIMLLLLIIILVSLWFLVRAWQGKELVPAATWLVYMFLP